MCIVALAVGQHPRLSLVLAANRDEYHARPALPAAPWPTEPAIAGGIDLEAGGSWLAARAGGCFAVVTNFRSPGAGRGARSRGALVRDFVSDSGDAAAWIGALAAQRADFAPFNLVIGDCHGAWWLESVSGRHGRFPPGTHAFSNGPVETPWPKCRAAAASLQHALRSGEPQVEAIMRALADTSPAADRDLPDTGVGRELERFLSPVHIVGDRYGTRASSVLALARDGRHWLLERRFGPAGAEQGESAWRSHGRSWRKASWPQRL